jgi:RimJ/RimL family protein N-acetyltransferase
MFPSKKETDGTHYLTGELCSLRGLDKDDASEKYLSWLQNPNVADLTYANQFPPTVSGLASWVDQFQKSSNSAGFAVIAKDTDQHIGNATLNGINWVTRYADLGLMIGDPDYIDREVISDVWTSVINYAFGNLGLRRLFAGILTPATEYIEAINSLGFTKEGVWRQQSIVSGQYVDEELFGLLVDEWPK